MRKYVALETIELESGVIGLSELQADLRRNLLGKIGKGKFEITGPVQFKAGEIIGFESFPKALVGCIQDLDPPKIGEEAA